MVVVVDACKSGHGVGVGCNGVDGVGCIADYTDLQSKILFSDDVRWRQCGGVALMSALMTK